MARYTYSKRRAASIKKSAANRRKAVWKSRYKPKFKMALRARQTRKVGRNLMPKYGFLPDKVCCRLKATSEPFTLDPGTGGIAVVQNLTFNTLQVTGFNGRQAREWDEMSALYGKCYVIGAKVTVSAVRSVSGTPIVGVRWGIYTPKLDDPTATYPSGLTWADISEDHRLMKGVRLINAYFVPKTSSLTKKWSAKKWSGISDYVTEEGDRKYSVFGTPGLDPASNMQAGCNVWLCNCTNADTDAVTFNASIEYICVFTDRNQVNPSS